LHSDIGSLKSDVFVVSVRRGASEGIRAFDGASPKLLQTPEANRRHSAVWGSAGAEKGCPNDQKRSPHTGDRSVLLR
jgi:hypothetical protein